LVAKALEICKQIMQHLVKQGYTNQASRTTMHQAIIYIRGPDKRTIANWMNALQTLGFITLLGNNVFNLCFDNCPELIIKMVKDPKQKKLL